MAVEGQANTLRRSVDAWNTWRRENPGEEINLSSADLRRADLSGADLNNANLSNANLSDADLSLHIYVADLDNPDNLENANIITTELYGANLSGANLSGAILVSNDLEESANLSGARIGWTIFGNLDLRTMKGLETIYHHGPSIIGTDTLSRSHGDIPEIFLRQAGLDESFIEYVHSLTNKPIEYYTCFISYSSEDELFVRRGPRTSKKAGTSGTSKTGPTHNSMKKASNSCCAH